MSNTSQYSNYKSIRKLPTFIVNLLIANGNELWSLLKYPNPINKTVSLEERKKMISPNSINEDKYNIVFQKFTETAMTTDEGKVFAQIRMQVINGVSQSNITGRINVLFQIIVNNKQMTVDTDFTSHDNRAIAIMQNLIEILNGEPLSINGNYLFINGKIDYNGGFKLTNFNEEYSGYNLIMTMNVVD